MSEKKRVAFTTLNAANIMGPDSLTTGSKKSATAFLQDDDDAAMLPPAAVPAGSSSSSAGAPQQPAKTFRLDMELFDPNVNSFPEFNFSKLVHAEKKKLKKLSKSNGFADPFEENDDDVARIAKEFEKKYSGTSTGKGRRNQKDDYYDKGAGYDESDSFIDNTEAYDEIIPEEVETVGGGFYINSGALEFTHLANAERPEDAIKVTKSRKRALSTSSSSDGNEGEENRKNVNGGDKETVEVMPPTDSGSASRVGNVSPNDVVVNSTKYKNGHAEKKPKASEESKDVNLKQTKPIHHKDKKLEKLKGKDGSGGGGGGGGDSEANYSDSGNERDKDKEKEKDKVVVKTTTVKDMLKAKRDYFRKMQEEEVKSGLANGDKDSDSNDSDSESSTDSEPHEKKMKNTADIEESEKMRTSDAKLPSDLSASLLKEIEDFKTVVRASNHLGKSFHFNDSMIEIFLRIDDACSVLDKSIRNIVFAHLEFQLSLTKYYLLRKARTLRIKQEQNKTKRAFLKLKKAVDEVMPSIAMNYEANYRKIEGLRSIAIQNNVDESFLPRYPKKKFIWKDTIRNLLYELYQVRWTSSVVLRTRKETLNDFITNYLKEKVVPIWPEGWMKYEELKRELDKRKRPKDGKSTVDEATAGDSGRSLMSANNAVSIVSSKDLVVTISTKSEKKITDVPLSNSDTLTVTPIPHDVSQRSTSGGQNADVHHQKSHKPIPSSALSPSSSALSNNRSASPLVHVSSKSGSSSQGNHSSSTHKSSSHGDNSRSSNHKHTSDSKNSPTNGSSSHSSKRISSYDLTSPVKRATDHSINSIMSSRTTPSPTLLHSIGNSTPTSGMTSPPLSLTTKSSAAGSANNADTAITHVITVDNLKNTSDIISTSNKLINDSGSGNNSGPNGTIRIRSVATVNRCLEKEKKLDKDQERKKDVMLNATVKNDIRPLSRSSTAADDLVISESDSDGVEIVGVFPIPKKEVKKEKKCTLPISIPTSQSILAASSASTGTSHIHKSKHKDKQRHNYGSSRSASPGAGSLNVQNLNKLSHGGSSSSKMPSSSSSSSTTVNSRYNDLEASRRTTVEPVVPAPVPNTTATDGGDKDNDLDVYQIMQALKELEEMQQSNIHISSSKSPTNSRTGGSHASPINYI